MSSGRKNQLSRELIKLVTLCALLLSFTVLSVLWGSQPIFTARKGPLLPTLYAKWRSARVMVTPWLYQIASVNDGSSTYTIPDTAEDYEKQVGEALANGASVEIVRGVRYSRWGGIWGASWRIDGWTAWPETEFISFETEPPQILELKPAVSPAMLAVSHPDIAGVPRRSFSIRPGALLDAIGLFLLYLCIAQSILVIRLWPQRRSAGCQTCGYDLTGLTAPVCPECGSSIGKPDQAAT
ncbi:MAG: hypothetical protein D6692_11680 [Planctomycetota bacterium]|nr:MAG: hypothetical protein D6692_11680 [Planctomycetota bacterium]